MRLRSSLPALAVLACVFSPRTANAARPVLHDTNVIVDSTLVPDSEAVLYVEVRGATALRDSHPLAGAQVDATVIESSVDGDVDGDGGERAEGKRWPLGKTTTGAAGRALLRFRVPRIDAGRYELRVVTRSAHGESVVERPIEIVESAHLQVRTDRPVYRPGQPLRWRATLLSAANAHPLTDSEIEIVVEDPRGTAIWRGRETTDASGMILGEVPLGDDLVLGEYVVKGSARGTSAEQKVTVKQFVLPPFKVSVEVDDASDLRPGGTLAGTVRARYHYGEPVAGPVRVWIQNGGGTTLEGELDDGTFRFEVPVVAGSGALRISARVTDGAGRQHRAERAVPRPLDDLRIEIIPESQTLVAGARQWVTVITTDGQGALVPARVSLRTPTQRRVVKSSPGALRIAIDTPKSWRSWPPFTIEAEASTRDGRVAEGTRSVDLSPGARRLRIRRAVIESGEAIELDGRWAKDGGPVVLTLLRDGAPLARTVTVPKKGRLRASITPPPGLFGLFTVRAVDLHWDRKSGEATPRRVDSSVYLRPKVLDVRLRGPLRHAPGDLARIAVEVRDAAGIAIPGAGLAASVVDERVLALGDTPTDLVTALRELRVGDARAAGVAFASLLTAKKSAANRTAMRAIVEALPPEASPPSIVVAAAARLRSEIARVDKARGPLLERLVGAGAIGERGPGGAWRYRGALDAELAGLGWKQAERVTPWSEPTTWRYAAEVDPSLAFASFAVEIGTERLVKLEETLQKRHRKLRRLLHRQPKTRLGALVDRGLLDASLAVDPWGGELRAERRRQGASRYISVVAAGPDQRFGTKDDLVREDVFGESLIGLGTMGYGSGGGGVGYGRVTGSPAVRIGNARAGGPGEARVRRNFDETVLWIAGVRTDASGRATLEVPLADSVTGWEIAVEAVGGHGGVGTTSARLETFLAVHADADLPHSLTTGDRYAVPVAIANHSGKTERFEVVARVSGAATLVDGARQSLRVEDGDARPVHVTVRATRPGEALVRISLRAGGRSVDELERRIEVRAPGLVVRRLHASRLEAGRGGVDFDVPSDVADGSVHGTLTLFRGSSDQAMDGLEGMLSEPNGCFEQTSSATYPNLLVLDLLKGQTGSAALLERARDLVAKGYQRLISYEVEGGGFSWFGNAPANQVLTAYGLLEFVDMNRVYPVDEKLIERTRAWVLGKQQRDGSWLPDASWLHDWSAVQGKVSTTAYIAWALAESGYRGRGLDRALAYLRRNAKTLRKEPYLSSLWAAAEAAAGTKDRRALAALRASAVRDGKSTRYSAGGATLFYGTGDQADVQVTAMAAQALHRRGLKDEAARALEWLWSKRQPSYGWGTTQSTVLALRASAIAAPKDEPATGKAIVELDGVRVGELDLDAPELPTLELAGLDAGKHELRVVAANGGSLRAAVRLVWRQRGVPDARDDGLRVSLETPRTPPVLGTLTSLAVEVHNPGDDVVAMPTILVPVPPGLRADPSSLTALERSGVVARAEDRGSEIAFYLEELAAGAIVRVPYALEATAVCDVLQRPARAYAYYSPKLGGTSAASRIEIVRRERPVAKRAAAVMRLRSPRASLSR